MRIKTTIQCQVCKCKYEYYRREESRARRRFCHLCALERKNFQTQHMPAKKVKIKTEKNIMTWDEPNYGGY